jgi:hypothetical protein
MRIKIKANTAQQDNNYNLGGDAGRAKELLDRASSKQAAEAVNRSHWSGNVTVRGISNLLRAWCARTAPASDLGVGPFLHSSSVVKRSNLDSVLQENL